MTEPLRAFDGFDDFANGLLKQWVAPGLAVAVVKGSDVVFARGYGLRDVEKQLPVTPQSLFAIGSSTKAFTALSVAMLVDEGKLEWDQPVRDVLPSFRLHDDVATNRATVRDLLAHRTGLPRHDLMWYGSPLSRREIFDRLRYLEPSKDFRETWQYQNLMYLTAGYLIGELSGMSWEEFVRERIFKPLGMTGSNFSTADSQRMADHAVPCIEKDDAIQPIPFRELPEVAPAGAINSNLDDMAKWVAFHLNGGKAGGKQLVSPGNVQELHMPHMVMSDPLKYPELLHMSYGMGWFIQPYRGHNHVHHGGNIDGFSALVSFLPREQIGVVAFANQNGSSLPTLATFNVFDRLLGLEPADWNARFWQDHLEFKAATKRGQAKAEAERKPNAPSTHALAEYAGEYNHPGYGVLTIAEANEKLTLCFNGLELPLKHMHYDVFQARYELFDMDLPISFGIDYNGNLATLTAPFEPNVAPIVFQRRAAQSMREEAFLAKCTGTYELMGVQLVVTRKSSNVLAAQVQGQPEIELEPYQGTTFNFKGLTGFSIEFVTNENGDVTSALVNQGGVVFEAKRV